MNVRGSLYGGGRGYSTGQKHRSVKKNNVTMVPPSKGNTGGVSRVEENDDAYMADYKVR